MKNTTAQDLKIGSIVQIITNLSPDKMDYPLEVTICRTSEKYLWFKYNNLQRMGRNTFDTMVQHFGYKIISL
tara:strand:- start:79 stop:294 length:216 start_codon:yes stop_codon:yes gene_type:complete